MSAAGRRDEVVAAFERGDVLGVRRVGWWAVWEAAAQWWAPRQTCTSREFVAYAKLLGDEDPAGVLEAFRALVGDWRPTPAQVRAYLHRPQEESGVSVGRSRDPAKTDQALRAVAQAALAGEPPCSCDLRRPTWTIDAAGVLRCPACRGLEAGQIYDAEDLGLIAEKAA
jgi:hypothetical protein